MAISIQLCTCYGLRKQTLKSAHSLIGEEVLYTFPGLNFLVFLATVFSGTTNAIPFVILRSLST
jgi:hypothetical protein